MVCKALWQSQRWLWEKMEHNLALEYLTRYCYSAAYEQHVYLAPAVSPLPKIVFLQAAFLSVRLPQPSRCRA